MSKKHTPKINSVDPVGSTRWLALKTLNYTDEKGAERKWDMATRTTKQAIDKADAVLIIPILRHGGSSPNPNNSKKLKTSTPATLDTIIVRQYRPPMQAYTLEFPAGLIDKDETPEKAALRELYEETGYIGEQIIPASSPLLCMTPGLTDESVHMILVNVDLNDSRNVNPKQHLDAGENVEIKRIPLVGGLKEMLDQQQGGKGGDGGFTGVPISMLYTFALGVEMGMNMGAN